MLPPPVFFFFLLFVVCSIKSRNVFVHLAEFVSVSFRKWFNCPWAFLLLCWVHIKCLILNSREMSQVFFLSPFFFFSITTSRSCVLCKSLYRKSMHSLYCHCLIFNLHVWVCLFAKQQSRCYSGRLFICLYLKYLVCVLSILSHRVVRVNLNSFLSWKHYLILHIKRWCWWNGSAWWLVGNNTPVFFCQ